MTDSGVAARDLVTDPNYLAYRLDFNTEKIGFLPVEREEIRSVSALKKDFVDPGRQLIEVPLADVVGVMETSDGTQTARPVRFVFHTAFCASTFLSRCLDVEGYTVSLKEPQLLLDAANAKRLQWRSATTSLDYRLFTELAMRLLRKHASADEILIIKPINSVNNIATELMELTAPGKSLMLYTDARNFVLSTLRKGEGGKQTVRSMFDLIRCDFPHLANLQLSHTIHMTDLRVAMTLWRLQIEQAAQVIQAHVAENAMASLYGERLIEQPEAVLMAANEFLDLGVPAERIRSVVSSRDLSRDAKNPGETFSREKREERYRQLEEYLGADLTDGLDWLVRNNPGTRLHPELDGALPA